jgi:hypothetical protein
MKNKFLMMFVIFGTLVAGANLYAAEIAPNRAVAAPAMTAPSNSLPATGPSGDHPCAKDAQTYCAGKAYGKGLVKCMKENNAKLAPACKEKIESFFAPDRAKKAKK